MIVGGRDDRDNPLSSLLLFDLRTFNSTLVVDQHSSSSSLSFGPHSGHGASFIPSISAVVIAGGSADRQTLFSTFFLDPRTPAPLLVDHFTHNHFTGRRYFPLVSLDDNTHSSSSSSTTTTSSSAIAIGGYGTGGTRLNDVLLFDVRSPSWTTIEPATTATEIPKPRYSHRACLVPGIHNNLVMQGGFGSSDLWQLSLSF